MSNNTQYVFKPRPEIADWIDENISSWTVFCYENIYKTQKRDYYDRFNRLSNRIGWILIGCIPLSLTYILPDLFTQLIFFNAGAIAVIIGLIGFIWEIRNGRR